MRLTLSLGVEHAGRAEGGIGLVGVGGPGKSHALGLGLLGSLGSLGGRSQAGLCDSAWMIDGLRGGGRSVVVVVVYGVAGSTCSAIGHESLCG